MAKPTLLHCLGSGGYYPNDRRHTSCYFVPQWGLVLDAGTGIFRLPNLIQTDRIDIVLSHCHLDHVFGLTVLLDVVYRRPVKTINVWADPKKIAAIQQHLLCNELFPVPLPVNFCPLPAAAPVQSPGQSPGQSPDQSSGLSTLSDPVQLPFCSVRCFNQSHPGGSLGFRIQSRSDLTNLVYATDTVGDAGDSFAKTAAGTDLLIHECNFRSEHKQFAEKTGHTHADRLIEIIQNTHPKQVLITHVSPTEQIDDPVGLETIRSAVDADVELAVDEKVIRFGCHDSAHPNQP